MLLIICTKLVFANNHTLTTDKLLMLEDLLKDNKLNELILEGEALKNANSESISLRTLLFKAYLYSDYLVKAAEELSFIKKRVQNDETVYLHALEAMHTNNLNLLSNADKIITLLATIKNSRYTPPYLLRAELFALKKQFVPARIELDTYRALEGETGEWFFNYGKFLLRLYNYSGSSTIATTEIRTHIERYARAFPANHEQMFLKAEYYASLEQYDYALQYIDRAIYLSFSKREYLNKKLYYLYRSQQFKKLVGFIASIPANTWNKSDTVHYLWVSSFINFINFKDNSKLFRLINQSALSAVIKPLEKVLTLNPEHEVLRFFLEEILLANTDAKAAIREPYANYRYRRFEEVFARARTQEARFQLERTIALAPFNETYRTAYMEHLRFNEEHELYHREAQNYQTIFTNIPQNLRIRFQSAEQKLHEGLTERYRISDRLSSPEISVLLVYNQRSYQNSWNQPYLEAIVARMLQLSHADLPLASISTASVKELGDQPPHDYEVHFQINDQDNILTINLKILDPARLNIFDQSFSFYGKDRYAKMLTKWKELSYQVFPKVGRVSAVADRQSVVSLGKIHGAKVGDKVQLLKNGSILGEFSLEIVNNYYSLITIDKIFTLSKTEIGDRVVLVPTVTTKN